MLSKKQKEETKNLKYFPEEKLEDYKKNIKELDDEADRLKKKIGKVKVASIFDMLTMEQKAQYYLLYLDYHHITRVKTI